MTDPTSHTEAGCLTMPAPTDRGLTFADSDYLDTSDDPPGPMRLQLRYEPLREPPPRQRPPAARNRAERRARTRRRGRGVTR